jgi:hypothetical protein
MTRGLPTGLPDLVPLRWAWSSPATTRSRMIARSSSAMAAMMVNIALPMGVLVSRASWCETKSIPRDRNSSSAQHELFDAAGETVKPPNYNDVKQSALGICHQGVKAGPSLFRTAGPVRIDSMNAPSSLGYERPNRFFLDLWVLVKADFIAMPGPI